MTVKLGIGPIGVVKLKPVPAGRHPQDNLLPAPVKSTSTILQAAAPAA